jgi:uncharacterized protein YecE (DUF72 family)
MSKAHQQAPTQITNPDPLAAPQAAGRIRIGISGWRYKGWRGIFYPPKLPQRRELEFASRAFDTVEINGTFYSLQHPSSFRTWAAETPDDFLFALKGSRFITHMKKLRGIDEAFSNLLASGLLALGPKLGPILWQFPPQMHFDPSRFEHFFTILPRSTAAAAKLAVRCHDRMLPRSVLEAPVDIPLRHAVEIRHESFATQPFLDLLRRHDIGLVVADTVEWPLLLDVTSSLVYIRLHGSEQLYLSGYESDALDIWADRIITWATGGTPLAPAPADLTTPNAARRIDPVPAPTQPRDVFVYFDNDAKVRAPFDAQNLRLKVDALLDATQHA